MYWILHGGKSTVFGVWWFIGSNKKGYNWGASLCPTTLYCSVFVSLLAWHLWLEWFWWMPFSCNCWWLAFFRFLQWQQIFIWANEELFGYLWGGSFSCWFTGFYLLGTSFWCMLSLVLRFLLCSVCLCFEAPSRSEIELAIYGGSILRLDRIFTVHLDLMYYSEF